jgi:hypothetical protein
MNSDSKRERRSLSQTHRPTSAKGTSASSATVQHASIINSLTAMTFSMDSSSTSSTQPLSLSSANSDQMTTKDEPLINGSSSSPSTSTSTSTSTSSRRPTGRTSLLGRAGRAIMAATDDNGNYNDSKENKYDMVNSNTTTTTTTTSGISSNEGTTSTGSNVVAQRRRSVRQNTRNSNDGHATSLSLLPSSNSAYNEQNEKDTFAGNNNNYNGNNSGTASIPTNNNRDNRDNRDNPNAIIRTSNSRPTLMNASSSSSTLAVVRPRSRTNRRNTNTNTTGESKGDGNALTSPSNRRSSGRVTITDREAFGRRVTPRHSTSLALFTSPATVGPLSPMKIGSPSAPTTTAMMSIAPSSSSSLSSSKISRTLPPVLQQQLSQLFQLLQPDADNTIGAERIYPIHLLRHHCHLKHHYCHLNNRDGQSIEEAWILSND